MRLTLKNDKFWLFTSLVSFAIFYLNLIWKTTGNIDQLITDLLFWVAILWLLWRRREKLNCNGGLFSTLLGLWLIALILIKSISLFSFEYTLIPLIPSFGVLGLAVVASGFQGLSKYWRELFFAWFLFFPPGTISFLLNKPITVLTAKMAVYCLYFLGFNVASQGNEVLLSLPQGNFKAIVFYSCVGVPMILLILKVSLLLVSFFPVKPLQRIVIPTVSIGLGFALGIIRVCLLTLSIPKPAMFEYWHGSEGNQIFSTLAIVLFSGFCYLVLKQKNILIASSLPKQKK